MPLSTLFTGSGVALATPFTPEGIDYDTFGRLIDFQIDERTDALIVCGTTGEPSTMTGEEREAAIEFAVRRAQGRVPVIAGAGDNDTRRSVQRARRAQALGADGLLVVTPYYNKATQRGLVEHFETIADAVTIPMILYNVPSRTGVNILPETAERLSRHENIVGIKEANANSDHMREMARRVEGKMALYSGNDSEILSIMALGGAGVISVAANVMPRQVHDMVENFLAGEIAACRAAQFQYSALFDLLFCEVNPIPVKAALSLMGFGSSRVRLPLTELSRANRRLLEAEMHSLGLI